MSTAYITMLVIGFSIIAILALQPAYKQYRRKRISYQQFPGTWKKILSNNWPIYDRLPDMLKQNLNERIKLFIAEKQFVGCNDFEIRENHKILIAAQACLLIVNKSFSYYDKLTTILVYPTAFIVNRNRQLPNGTVSEEREIYSGEAWETGKIILSWDDTLSGMRNWEDGNNVVIHEFAHLLDHTNGSANGAPALEHAVNYQRWSEIFSAAFERLQITIDNANPALFNPYGASSPGEFFAVASELFFEKSRMLQQQEPELYQQLVKFYAVDPALW